MRIPVRPILAALLALGLFVSAAPAQDAEDAEATAFEHEDAGAVAQQTEKQAAKERRIADYLKNKEEGRLLREQERVANEARELEKRQLADPQDAGAAAAGAVVAADATVERGDKPSLPKGLAMAQAHVRETSLAADPTVQELLERIDWQEASAYELAAFGNFLSEHGLHHAGLEYYKVALRLEDDDEVLWVNIGTLRRKVGDLSGAASAYSKALSLNPNYALAHYNYGAIMDAQDKYKEAIHAYQVALTLDPTLGDPEFNPQVANNRHMTTVKTLLYQANVGTAGLPLVDVSTESLESAAGSDAP
jgi:tetratricopeptide (TPR) repeat protein